MGKATRWLKDLFGLKGRQKHNTEYSVQPRSRLISGSGPLVIPPNISPAEAAWLTSFYNEPDNRQKQHARAVAAATAAAADAALATALAAAKVVHLTSQGREKLAAAKIQSVFRGYLARKALRALRALVKIQALVRGFLVRKQAAATLQRMQALVRSQEIIRALKEHPTIVSKRLSSSARNACDKNSKIVEMDTGCWPKSRRANIYFDPSANVVMSSPLTSVECKNPRNLDPYMSAESLKAKQRSKSAPRQRPEPGPIRKLTRTQLFNF